LLRRVVRFPGGFSNSQRLLRIKGFRRIDPVIPPPSSRKAHVKYDHEAYKRRNLIERWVNPLKQFRRFATRYEKTATAYCSMLCIAAARLWVKTVNTA
jgi:transposase